MPIKRVQNVPIALIAHALGIRPGKVRQAAIKVEKALNARDA